MLARILALALAIYPAIAFAQLSPILGFPPGVFQNRAAIDAGTTPPPPSSPVLLTYQGTSGNNANSGNSYTFGTITIGAVPSINRKIVVAFTSQEGLNPIVSAVFTPNSGSPVNADVTTNANSGDSGIVVYLVSAILPVGTTTTLSVTLGSPPASPARFSVYTLDNSTLSNINPTLFSTNTTTPPTSVSATTPSGSAAIALFEGFNTSTNSFTAGVSNDGAFGVETWGSLSNASSSPTTITNTWTGSGADPALYVWVFR